MMKIVATYLLALFSLCGAMSQAAAEQFHFGRMFPHLEALDVSNETLLLLGKPSPDTQNPAYMEDSQVRGTDNNSANPVGHTYVGQLMTHDISLDDTSILGERNNPSRTPNRATPWLDLDTLYRFDRTRAKRDGSDFAKLALGNALGNERDFKRDDNGHAFIADRRNDENNNVAQVAAIFIALHNKFVDDLRANGVRESKLFQRAKALTIAHWQSVLLYDFLPTFVEQSMIDDVLTNGPQVYRNALANAGTVPVEFSVAATRFGHSTTRGRYTLNPDFDRVRLFALSEEELDRNLSGGVPIPPERQIEWPRFFDFSDYGIGGGDDDDQFSGLQVARKIDRLMARPMLRLPIGGPGLPEFILDPDNTVAGIPTVSLPAITLLRGKAFGLPSGQDVARSLGVTPLDNAQFDLDNPDEIVLPEPLDEAPLMLYLFEEARIQNDGEKLGDVGGRIVTEVVLSLLKRSPRSILRRHFVSPITNTTEVTIADVIVALGWLDE